MALLKANTGIGTTNPTSALHVIGDVLVTGVVTATTFNGNINTGVATITTAIITDLTNTRLTSGVGTITNLNNTFLNVSGVGSIATLNAPVGNINVGIITGLTNTRFTSGIATITNLISTASTITDLTNTRLTSGVGTITNLTGTNATLTRIDSTHINAGIVTATQLSTGAIGSSINITSDTITGPSTIIMDPAGVGDNTGSVHIKGDLYVDGTQFVVNSSTIELADLRVGIATTVGSNILLDGGGIGIGSDNILKTFTYNYASDSLKSSENLDIASGKIYKINGTDVLSDNTLGSGVIYSSLQYLGTLNNLNVSGLSTLPTLVGTYATITEITNTRFTSGIATITDLTVTNSTFTNVNANNLYAVTGVVTDISGTRLNYTGVGTITTLNSTYTNLTNINATGISTLADIRAERVTVTGIVTANSFRPSSGYIQAADGTNSFYIYNSTGNVSFQGTIGVNQINNGGGYQVITFNNTDTRLTGNLNIAGVTTSSVFNGNIYSLGVSTFRNGPVLIGTGTSTGTAFQPLQVTGGGYVSGNFGIGEVNPTSKLQITGDALVTGVVTATAFNGNINAGVGTITTLYNETATINNLTSNFNNTGVATITTLNSTHTNLININSTGISTLNIVRASTLQVSGVSTFTGAITGTISTATKLETPRTFEITGDIVASPILFDGTGNVSLAATIQPNSVALGSDTTGDYVQNISGTVNQITVTGGSGESSTPVIAIADSATLPGNVTIANDLQVNHNLNVSGNITIGGTTAYIITQDFRVKDADIILGFTTDAYNNDVSNDTTANHGGIAVASTEGTPLTQLFIAGIETTPATYKKIMWFQAGSYAGLGTDAWLMNYAVGIGSTQFPTGTRLAAGSVQFTENDLAVVRNINASGILTAVTGNFTTANITTGNVTDISGTRLNYTGVGTITTLNSNTATINNLTSNFNNTGVGTVTILSSGIGTINNLNNTFLNVSGIGSIATLYSPNAYVNVGVITDLTNTRLTSGIGTINNLTSNYANIDIGTVTILNSGIGTITNLNNTFLNVSGVGSIATLNASVGNINVGVITNLTNTRLTSGIGTINDLNNTFLNVSGVGSIATLNATTGTVNFLSGINLNYSGITTLAVTSATNLTTQNINNSGILTTNSLNIGATQVISAARQLQNIASLDAVTTATIEAAIQNAPNTFTDLQVTGISTLGVTSTTDLTAQQLYVSGISTFVGIVTSQSTIFTPQLSVSGIATISKLDVDRISPDGADYGGPQYLLRANGDGTWGWANVPGIFSVNNILNGFNVSDEGLIVGTAGSITQLDFRGNNIVASAAPQPNGIATVRVSDTPDFLTLNVSGITTLAGITTVTGETLFTKQLSVSGVSTFTGIGTYVNDLYVGNNLFVKNNLVSDTFTARAITVIQSSSLGDASASSLNVTGVGTIATLNATNATITNINSSGIITASQFSTGAVGSAINITNNSITGPSSIVIDPAAVGDDTGAVRIKGDFYVDGTQFVVNSTSIELGDFNVGIATTVGTNLLLDGAGIGIGSANIRKTLTYDYTNDALKSSENFNIPTGKTYKINGVDVLSETTLGSGVLNSSLTSVGTLKQLLVSGVTTSTNGFVGNLTGTASNATYAVTAGVATYAGLAGVSTSVIGGISSVSQEYVTGIATFVNGPVFVGSGTSTGTPAQPLQVTGGAYISESTGIGTTNPRYKLDVIGDINFNGNLFQNGSRFTSGIGIGSTSVNPQSGFINQRIGIGFTDLNIVGTGISVTGYGTTVVIDFGNIAAASGGALSISTVFNPRIQDVTFVGGATTSRIGISTQTDRFVYDTQTGSVGIGTSGTSIPAYKLDVVGDINSSTSVKIKGIDVLEEAVRLAIAFG